jgi:transcriptional regulator with XRE-family HTH domain
MEPAQSWSSLLRAAREAVRLTRAEVANSSGVAAATIKAYELGVRNPSRPLLTAILTALQCDRYLRNQVLEAAGFRPDGLEVWHRNPDFALSFDEACAEIRRAPWPAIVTAEGLKVVAANAAYDALWGRRPGAAAADEAGGFLSWMSYPPYADRLKNWDEVMGFLIGVLKGSLRFPQEVPEASAHMRPALERFFAGDPGYIGRYLDLWDRTAASVAKARFSYRIVFDHILLGQLSFRCVGAGVNEVDGLIINDWIPADAETWQRLGARSGATSGEGPTS